MSFFTESIGLGKTFVTTYAVPGRQQRLRQLYKSFISPGTTAFDVGSLAGEVIRPWLSLGAKVVAIEPQPKFSTCLEGLYGRDDRVIVETEGVGAMMGVGECFFHPLHPKLTTCSRSMVESTPLRSGMTPSLWQRMTIPMTTLNDLARLHGTPQYIRIDNSGYEFEALRGISFPVDNLSFAAFHHFPEIAIQCVNRLLELGHYRFNWRPVQDTRLLLGRWVHGNEMREFIFHKSAEGLDGEIFCRRFDY